MEKAPLHTGLHALSDLYIMTTFLDDGEMIMKASVVVVESHAQIFFFLPFPTISAFVFFFSGVEQVRGGRFGNRYRVKGYVLG